MMKNKQIQKNAFFMISKFSKRKRERLKEIEEKLRELERKEEIS